MPGILHSSIRLYFLYFLACILKVGKDDVEVFFLRKVRCFPEKFYMPVYIHTYLNSRFKCLVL